MPPTCSICKRPLNVHQRARGDVCDDLACRTAAAQRAAARARAEEQARLEALAQPHVQALLGHEHGRDVVATMVLCTTDDPLLALPHERREKLRASLTRAVAQSAAEPPPSAQDLTSVAAPDATPALAAAACATCRGHCCRYGGDSGYIDAPTVRRVREQRPDLDAAQLLALYLDAVPAQSVAGSCVFHGEQGCALPRPMRASVCNAYYCAPLRRSLAQPRTGVTAVVVLQDQRLLRSRLVTTAPT